MVLRSDGGNPSRARAVVEAIAPVLAGTSVSGREEVAGRRDHETQVPLHERLVHRALRLKARDGRQQITLAVRRLRRDLLLEQKQDALVIDEH
jgi:hypothetical protein